MDIALDLKNLTKVTESRFKEAVELVYDYQILHWSDASEYYEKYGKKRTFGYKTTDNEHYIVNEFAKEIEE